MGTTPYGARTLVAVKATTSSVMLYGFFTNTEEAQRTVLGQIAAVTGAGAYIPNLAIGVNAPKPARATRYRTGGGFDTSFVDITKLDAARAASWKIVSRPKIRLGSNSSRAKCVYVTLAGDEGSQIKYAWMMPNFLYAVITTPDKTALKIKDATADDKDLVFGARYPKPPRAVYTAIAANSSIGSRSTFVDPSAMDSLPNGWKPSKNTTYE